MQKKIALFLAITFFAVCSICAISFSTFFNPSPRTAHAQAPVNGLMGYWAFDEGSGTVAYDSSGNGTTGTLMNGVLWAPGKIGTGVAFDGTTPKYVSLGNPASLSNLPAFTWSFWAYIPNASTSQGPVLEIGAGSGIIKDVSFGPGFGSGQGEVTARVAAATTKAVSITVLGTYATNTWQHWTVTYNDAGDRMLHIYKNGVEVSYATQMAAAGAETSESTYKWSVGATVATQFSKFDGTIDELRVYNRVLSPQEITAVYNDTGIAEATSSQQQADTTPPSVPMNLSASAISSSQITLSWAASTDNVGVAGYKVYRGGEQIATTTSTTHTDENLSPSTSYTYAVAAYDAAGNVSAQSASVSATTQAVPETQTTSTQTKAASNAPVIFYTDIIAGPNSGWENGDGAYLSIFGKNFGTDIDNISVTVGGGAVARKIYLGASYGRPDVQQLSVQLGPACATGNVVVTVGGQSATAPETFTVRSGDVFYVSTSGNDSTGIKNDITHPYRTANKVMGLTDFGAGDFMVIRGGDYDLSSGNENLYSNKWLNLGLGYPTRSGGEVSGTAETNAITIYGYPGETPVVDWGTDTHAFDSYVKKGIVTGDHTGVDYYAVANLVFDLKDSGGVAIGWGFYSMPDEYVNHSRLVNVKVKGGMAGASQGVNTVSLARVDYIKLYGFNIGNQSSLAESDVESHMIYMSHAYTNADIGWIYVHDNAYGRAALQIAGDTWCPAGVTPCSAGSVEPSGGFSHGAPYYTWGLNTNVRVHDSLFQNLPSQAILCNLGSTGISIYSNVFVNCSNHSYYSYGQYSNWAVIDFRGDYSPGEMASVRTYTPAGTYSAYNNTIYSYSGTQGTPASLIQAGYSPQGTCPASATLKNNIIYAANPSTEYYAFGGSPDFTQNQIAMTSGNNDWYGSSQSLPGFASSEMSQDPKFTNSSGLLDIYTDFIPQPSSPAINAGTNLSSIFTTDFFGTPRSESGPWDIGAIAYASAGQEGGPSTDTTPPTISITSPSSNTTISGTTSVSASASDNVGVTEVLFYLDGTLQMTDTTAPYAWSWNTTNSSNGTHAIMAKAYDAAGNTGISGNVTVTVNNKQTSMVTQPSSGGSSSLGGSSSSGGNVSSGGSSSYGGGGGSYYSPTPIATSAPSSSLSTGTQSSILATIETLLTELRSLVIQLLTSSNNGRPLTIGSKGTDVWALQVFLAIDGKGPASEKLASIGPTGTFGSITKAALAEYQSSMGITPSTGYFGQKTRAAIMGH